MVLFLLCKEVHKFVFHLHCRIWLTIPSLRWVYKIFYVKPWRSWVIICTRGYATCKGRPLPDFYYVRSTLYPAAEPMFTIYGKTLRRRCEAKDNALIRALISLTKPWGTRLAMLTMFSTSCLRIIFVRWCNVGMQWNFCTWMEQLDGTFVLGWNNIRYIYNHMCISSYMTYLTQWRVCTWSI